MQLLVHIPDELGARFKQTVPTRMRSAFVRRLIESALPIEEDPLYRLAQQVEADAQLNAEMADWDAVAEDGLKAEP